MAEQRKIRAMTAGQIIEHGRKFNLNPEESLAEARRKNIAVVPKPVKGGFITMGEGLVLPHTRARLGLPLGMAKDVADTPQGAAVQTGPNEFTLIERSTRDLIRDIKGPLPGQAENLGQSQFGGLLGDIPVVGEGIQSALENVPLPNLGPLGPSIEAAGDVADQSGLALDVLGSLGGEKVAAAKGVGKLAGRALGGLAGEATRRGASELAGAEPNRSLFDQGLSFLLGSALNTLPAPSAKRAKGVVDFFGSRLAKKIPKETQEFMAKTQKNLGIDLSKHTTPAQLSDSAVVDIWEALAESSATGGKVTRRREANKKFWQSQAKQMIRSFGATDSFLPGEADTLLSSIEKFMETGEDQILIDTITKGGSRAMKTTKKVVERRVPAKISEGGFKIVKETIEETLPTGLSDVEKLKHMMSVIDNAGNTPKEKANFQNKLKEAVMLWQVAKGSGLGRKAGEFTSGPILQAGFGKGDLGPAGGGMGLRFMRILLGGEKKALEWKTILEGLQTAESLGGKEQFGIVIKLLQASGLTSIGGGIGSIALGAPGAGALMMVYGAGSFLTPMALVQLYQSEAFRKLATEAVKTGAGTQKGMEIVVKMAALAQKQGVEVIPVRDEEEAQSLIDATAFEQKPLSPLQKVAGAMGIANQSPQETVSRLIPNNVLQ